MIVYVLTMFKKLTSNAFIFSTFIFGSEEIVFSLGDWAAATGMQITGTDAFSNANKYSSFSVDGLSKLITLFIGFLALLISVYSIMYKTAGTMRNYHAWFLITLGFSFGAVLSNNLLLFLICWGQCFFCSAV